MRLRRFLALTSLMLLIAGLVSPAYSQAHYPSCSRQPREAFTVVDTVRYIISYHYSTYRDPEHPALRDNDEVWLEIGNTITKQYSRPRAVNDSLAQTQISRGFKAYSPLRQWCMREEVFCEIANDTVVWTYQDLLFDMAYAWSEKWPTQMWRMEEGSKEIIGYRCRRATVSFRGRHYTAWYAPDLPLPYGPWSFHGLPGLILEIRDDTNRVAFEANWLVCPSPARPLVQHDGAYVLTTRHKARKLIDLMHRHPYIHAGEWGRKHMSWLRENPKLEWKHTWVELE